MKVLPCGDTGLLVEVADLRAVVGLYRRLVERDLAGVVGLVPASRTLLVQFDPARTSGATIAGVVRDLDPHVAPSAPTREVEVPVVYDGEDLEQVAELTGLGVRGVITAHTGQVWTVGFVGFAPGFGYLVGEDRRLHVPRHPHPRSSVPVGAVGLADEFSGIYPRRSPGGWRLIGRTEVTVWDVAREPPALLEPGAQVRFVEAR
ncbi:5-oxoprolinase subunit B family protein [Nitriliruptor alkaliphilus]|uniref:5-oxoprolinase subunit B family protein n=1 Tax=Nitriliruptor alkaliphilus TaxID=427918 RepID=UPI000695B5CC|nr:allophanate hydrolase subunit 1 [Nitriliruptor alkaliphilus]